VRVTFHPCAALTPLNPCMLGPMVDVITHALFSSTVSGVRELRKPQIPYFLYLAIMTLTTVSTTVLYCDLKFKNFNFWSRDCDRLTICCSVPNFIEIGQFFTKIWQFNDFQNGGRPPSWILNMCCFCHVAIIDMPWCFLVQNFTEIGQLVDQLWPKKRLSR